MSYFYLLVCILLFKLYIDLPVSLLILVYLEFDVQNRANWMYEIQDSN